MMNHFQNVTLFSLAAAGLLIVLAGIGAAPTSSAVGGNVKHRVVFEVTMDGAEEWSSALNNVENVQKAFGAAAVQIEVVGHGRGLGMLLSKNAEQAERLKKIADGGVVFAACENTMRKKGVKKEDLLPFVSTVDSGVAEVVRKQEAGWAYIKSGT